MTTHFGDGLGQADNLLVLLAQLDGQGLVQHCLVLQIRLKAIDLSLVLRVHVSHLLLLFDDKLQTRKF